MKTLLLVLALIIPSASVQAQLLGTFTDLPKNVFGVGMGIGPTKADVSAYGAYGRLLSQTGTYSLTGINIVPARAVAANGQSIIVVTPTVTTGVEQVWLQKGRVTAAVDAGIGASLPSTGTPSFSLAEGFAGGLSYRLNKDITDANKYLTFAVKVYNTQVPVAGTSLTTNQLTTVAFIGIAWGSGGNGATTASTGHRKSILASLKGAFHGR